MRLQGRRGRDDDKLIMHGRVGRDEDAAGQQGGGDAPYTPKP